LSIFTSKTPPPSGRDGDRLRPHELLRVAVRLERAPVLPRETVEELAHGATDLEQLV
jgi:hypothetical protein